MEGAIRLKQAMMLSYLVFLPEAIAIVWNISCLPFFTACTVHERHSCYKCAFRFVSHNVHDHHKLSDTSM